MRFPGAALGVPVGPARLVTLCGLAAAKYLLLSSRTVGADEALRLGLVNRVAPAAGDRGVGAGARRRGRRPPARGGRPAEADAARVGRRRGPLGGRGRGPGRVAAHRPGPAVSRLAPFGQPSLRIRRRRRVGSRVLVRSPAQEGRLKSSCRFCSPLAACSPCPRCAAAATYTVDSTADEADNGRARTASATAPAANARCGRRSKSRTARPAIADAIVFDGRPSTASSPTRSRSAAGLPAIIDPVSIDARQSVRTPQAGSKGPCVGVSGAGRRARRSAVEDTDGVEIDGLAITGAHDRDRRRSTAPKSFTVRTTGSGSKLDGSAGGNEHRDLARPGIGRRDDRRHRSGRNATSSPTTPPRASTSRAPATR